MHFLALACHKLWALRETENAAQKMRFKHNANAHQREIIVMSFEKSYTTVFIACFPLNWSGTHAFNIGSELCWQFPNIAHSCDPSKLRDKLFLITISKSLSYEAEKKIYTMYWLLIDITGLIIDMDFLVSIGNTSIQHCSSIPIY